MPRLDHRDAHLVVLGGQAARHTTCLPTRAKIKVSVVSSSDNDNMIWLNNICQSFCSVFPELSLPLDIDRFFTYWRSSKKCLDDDFYLGLLTFLLLGLIRFSFFVSSSKATPRRLSRLKILFEKFQTWGNIVAFSTCLGGIPPSPHYQSPLFHSYSCHLPQLPDYYRQTKVLFKIKFIN